MTPHYHTNRLRAEGFGRFVRIATVATITLALAKCGFGQVAFAAPFSVRISSDTTEIRHSIAQVSITDALTIRLQGGRTYQSAVTGAEVRESSVLYVLADGVAHHAQDKNGQMVVWSGSMGKWIFYDYLPVAVSINARR